MNVTLKNGKQGKVVIKNDLLLTDGDLNHVKAELNKFVRKPEDTKKAKRK